MRKLKAWCCAGVLAALGTAAAASAASAAGTSADPPASPAGQATAEPSSARIEARSADLLLVGLIRGDRMSIHLSRLIDNAPVRDAAVAVVLRGTSYPAMAETDGSFTLQAKDLGAPGSAQVDFQIVQATRHETLTGTLQVAGGSVARAEDKNTARQLWWWVLNFAVCIGFLYLISRRRKASQR